MQRADRESSDGRRQSSHHESQGRRPRMRIKGRVSPDTRNAPTAWRVWPTARSTGCPVVIRTRESVFLALEELGLLASDLDGDRFGVLLGDVDTTAEGYEIDITRVEAIDLPPGASPTRGLFERTIASKVESGPHAPMVIGWLHVRASEQPLLDERWVRRIHEPLFDRPWSVVWVIGRDRGEAAFYETRGGRLQRSLDDWRLFEILPSMGLKDTLAMPMVDMEVAPVQRPERPFGASPSTDARPSHRPARDLPIEDLAPAAPAPAPRAARRWLLTIPIALGGLAIAWWGFAGQRLEPGVDAGSSVVEPPDAGARTTEAADGAAVAPPSPPVHPVAVEPPARPRRSTRPQANKPNKPKQRAMQGAKREAKHVISSTARSKTMNYRGSTIPIQVAQETPVVLRQHNADIGACLICKPRTDGDGNPIRDEMTCIRAPGELPSWCAPVEHACGSSLQIGIPRGGFRQDDSMPAFIPRDIVEPVCAS